MGRIKGEGRFENTLRDRRPRAKRSRPGVLFRVFLVSFSLSVGGCLTTQEFTDGDGPLPSANQVEITAGRGISFKTLAGAPVNARRIVVEPGIQNLRLDVRRSLKQLKDKRLVDVYSVGSCRIRFDSLPGSRYRVEADPFMSSRLTYGDQAGPDGEERELIGVLIKVVDEQTGSEFLASGDACELRLDCRKMNRSVLRAGEECTF